MKTIACSSLWLRTVYFCLVLAFVIAGGCQWSGGPTQTETQVGRYRIIVSPGCRSQSSHRDTRSRSDGSEEILSAQFQCDSTTILIQTGELIVNGAAYGATKDGDIIMIRDGQVRVNSETRSVVNGK
jgi:hypothetical protein